jgi:hypothetical protein
MIANIRPHNERAAAVWGSGRSAYDNATNKTCWIMLWRA